eukprot:GEMP01042257.1.p1 GENE.GEMP01042257.1~~GEMP01042257.1.p1  ORF type:complete len:204 (+),score=60.70 GEMP01042257.1:156-767(+)
MVDKLAKKMAKYHLAKELLRKVDVPPNWRVTETVLHYASPLAAAPTNKIAGFDFDHTLCSGGLTWQVASMGTKNALERLHNDGFKICVFSNQTQIGKKLEESQMHYVTHLTLRRFQTFISWLEPVPCHLFLATARGDVDDCYRKPNVKMWHLMEELNAQPADLEASFYVGNSAGRRSDNTNVDQLFATNVGVRFFTEDVLHEW